MLPGHKVCACCNRCGQANSSLNTYLKMGLHLLQQACMRLGSHDMWRMPVGCNGKLYSEAADTVDGIKTYKFAGCATMLPRYRHATEVSTHMCRPYIHRKSAIADLGPAM